MPAKPDTALDSRVMVVIPVYNHGATLRSVVEGC